MPRRGQPRYAPVAKIDQATAAIWSAVKSIQESEKNIKLAAKEIQTLLDKLTKQNARASLLLSKLIKDRTVVDYDTLRQVNHSYAKHSSRM